MKLSLFIFIMLALVACDAKPPQYDGDLTYREGDTLPLDSDAASICADDLLWFEETVWQPVILETCISCHRAGDLASTTPLVFDPASSANSFSRLVNYSSDSERAQWLLDKPTGAMIHGGGQNFSTDSEQSQALINWLARQDQLGACQGEAKDLWQGVNLLSSQQTLRKASLLMAGRLPTSSEEEQLQQGGDEGLKQIIRGIINGGLQRA